MTPKASWTLVVFVFAACQELPDVDRDVCGNGVIEVGEDCEASVLDEDGNVVSQCGAFDGANACFYECSDTLACPDGYACGSDSRCRQASGRFVSGATFTLSVDDIAIGDVDGDGFDDIVAGSGTSLQVNFGSAQADLVSTLDGQVATPETALVLGDLDQSGTDDVLLATTPGVETFHGAPDRTIDPFSYPLAEFQPAGGLLLGAAYDLDPSTMSDDVIFAWADRLGFVLAGTTVTTMLPDPAGPTPGLAVGLAAPLPVARLGESRDDPSPPSQQDPSVEIALGFLGTQQIFLYQATTGPYAITDSGTVLDAGGLLNAGSGMFFGYFDGDACLDLVAHAGAGVGQLVVFRNTPSGADCTGVLRPPVPLYTPPGSIRLLGVTDLDGDSISDLVTSAGLFLVTGVGPWTVQMVAPAGTAYEGAQVVDLNGDEAPDVVAFRESQPDAEVLINAGGAFNRFVIATSDPVLRLAPGDFDGDLTQDIAIVELDSSGDAPVYTVSVSFGQFHGPPGPRVTMDRFAGIAGLVSASVVGVAGDLDAVDDLIVVEALSDAMQATVLFGSGARAMTSPLILVGDLGPESPESLVVGELDGTGGLDLFTVGGKRTAFLFSGDGAGGFELAAQAPWPGDFTIDDALWTSGDVDGDGVSEIAAAERNERGGVTTNQVVLFTPDPAAIDASVLAEPDTFTGAHSIELADLDGDLDLDLLVAFDTLDDEEGSLQVGWNDGSSITELEPLPGGDGCIAAVPIVLDGDAQPELLALCRFGEVGPQGLKRFELRRFDAVEPETMVVASEPLGEASGGRSTRLLTGDLDGDGLLDVVVSTKGFETADVRVFLQSDKHDLD
jgi:hypothetical protein